MATLGKSVCWVLSLSTNDLIACHAALRGNMTNEQAEAAQSIAAKIEAQAPGLMGQDDALDARLRAALTQNNA